MMPTVASAQPLAGAFLAAWRGERALVDLPKLEEALASAVESAGRQHPDLAVAPERFAAFLGARAEAGGDAAAALASLHGPDLYLACAALDGDPQALSHLDRHVLARAAVATARVDPSPQFVEDVRQRLRERLLIGPAGSGPKLAEYGGKGALLSWVKVMAGRVALNALPAREPELSLREELLRAGGDGRSLEAEVLNRLQSEQLEEAMKQAFSALDDAQRVLLRYHFADGLDFEQIAALFNTHRSTVSRRVAAAREALLFGTQAVLRERHGMSPDEISSLVRAAQSQVEMSIHSLFRSRSR